jgi:pilus assembly protein CpaC
MTRSVSFALVSSMVAALAVGPAAGGPTTTKQEAPAGAGQGNTRLTVTVGKSLIIDSPLNIQRISVANGDLVEAVAVNPKEVLINGKAAGDTTLIVWQQNGTRLLYDLTVRLSQGKVDAVRQQIAREIPDQDVTVTYENDSAFVRGTVKDVTTADRVLNIASTLGKTINLLRVNVPPPETQVLLRVRFANVDRGAATDLGVNLLSSAFNQATGITTGQYPAGKIDVSGNGGTQFTFSDALNIFLFRRDINLGATIKALQSKRLLEVLAEPNVMAINGKQASFVAGGEFPFPMLQGGAGVGSVTVAFREFGVRINFLPVVTPRGTIRLQVAPEVSSLDYANGVTFQGFTIPALATRRIQTEVELDSGQSFLIAGLLDNRMTETLNKIPGIGDIPLLGKLFQSKSIERKNTELLVLITPEVVRPIPADQKPPELNYPVQFMESNSGFNPRTPGLDKTGPVPSKPPSETMPVEELMQQQKQGQAAPSANVPPFQLVPIPVPSAPAPASPGLAPPPMSGAGGPGK